MNGDDARDPAREGAGPPAATSASGDGDTASDGPSDAAIEAAILRIVGARPRGRTVCPSEPARALGGEWRTLMPRVRRVAARLVREQRLVATRKGEPVDPEAPGGPIRLAAPPADESGPAQARDVTDME
jgi:hypothetical protein